VESTLPAVSLRILGAIEVIVDGAPMKCTGRQRDLLSLFVMQRNDRKSKPALIDDLYGDEPIPTSDASFRIVLSQLRKSLRPHDDVVLTGSLYGLRTDSPDLSVDSWEFDDLSRLGRQQLNESKTGEAIDTLQRALAMWRGRPFGGVIRVVQCDDDADRLDLIRIGAQEDLADALVQSGSAAQTVDRLASWVKESPERERLRLLHILSLYRCGRQHEAIDAIDTLNKQFADAGLTPTPSLRQFCDRIFQQSPILEGPAELPAALLLEPETLPAALQGAKRSFAGRETQRTLIAQKGRRSMVISGPGLGKTALLGMVGAQLLAESASQTPVNTQPTWVAYCACEPTEQGGLSAIRLGFGLAPIVGVQNNWESEIQSSLELIDRYRSSGALVLLVDDLHWADESTIRLLRRLLRRPADENLTIVCAGWPDELCEEFGKHPALQQVDLAPLTRAENDEAAKLHHAEIARLQDDLEIEPLNNDLLDLLWSASGGFPLLLQATSVAAAKNALHPQSVVLTAQIKRTGSGGSDSDLSRALQPVVRQLLRTLTAEQRNTAMYAAVIKNEIDEEALSRITSVAQDEIRKTVNTLVELGIVQGPFPFHFRHRSLRRAICDGSNRNEIGEIRRELARSQELDLIDRATHALHAPNWVGLEQALLQSKEGRRLAELTASFDRLVELSQFELELRSAFREDPMLTFELYRDLAIGHEALGNAQQGSHFRERGLQVAEQEGRFDWSLSVVLSPPAHGRAIAPGGSVSQISRAIALATPQSSINQLARLRAERLHRLAICGATKRIPQDEINWLRTLQPEELGLDGWIEVLRARLCSDLAVASVDERSLHVGSLAAVVGSSDDIDLRADGLVLVLRNCLEHQPASYADEILQIIDRELLNTMRPMDRWLRNIMRCTALAANGQLSAAFACAVEARRLGAKHGISDSLAGWHLQSRQLLFFDPSLPSKFPEVVNVAEFEDPTVGDSSMEGNLLAMGAALEAQHLAGQGFEDQAREMLAFAESMFDGTLADVYVSSAAAAIVRASYVLGSEPVAGVSSILGALCNTSILVAMIPGWSLGPALRYSALLSSIQGEHQLAINQLLSCAKHCREFGLNLWWVVTLEDALEIETRHQGGSRSSGIAAELEIARSHLS
jgi:DNA-binding SARP family transcriptional activator/type II secretory pathway predicted ATPase ExeA